MPLRCDDPAALVFRGAGSTDVDTVLGSLGAPSPSPSTCFRCGGFGQVWPYRRVVTVRFTGWEEQQHMLHGSGTSGWCVSCAYLYKNPVLRAAAHRVDVDGAVIVMSVEQVADVLCQPVAASQAYAIPVSGRKHVVPLMRWGCIATDVGAVAWTEAEARFAGVYAGFRGVGVPRALMAAETPPYDLVRACSEPLEALLTRWEGLRRWWGTPAWMLASRWL